MGLNFSKEKEPNEKIPYNHVTRNTPLGLVVIDWKGWKENPSYDISINDKWIDVSYNSLDDAKDKAESYIRDIYDSLKEFLENV